MNEKTFVSIEQRLCLVCANAYDTGALVLDRRFRSSLDTHTNTGWGLCPEHRKIHDEGLVALVACDREKSQVRDGADTVTPSQIHRTGVVYHVRWEEFMELFQVPFEARRPPCIFTEQHVIDLVKSHVARRAN